MNLLELCGLCVCACIRCHILSAHKSFTLLTQSLYQSAISSTPNNGKHHCIHDCTNTLTHMIFCLSAGSLFAGSGCSLDSASVIASTTAVCTLNARSANACSLVSRSRSLCVICVKATTQAGLHHALACVCALARTCFSGKCICR